MIPLAVASLGILATILAYVLEQRSGRRERMRELFGAALADVYMWTELPYRVRRRRPAEDAKFELSDQISDLQERLQHHEAWLRIESALVHAQYMILVERARSVVAPHLRKAWEQTPIQSDAEMSVGDLGIDIDSEVNDYVRTVGRHLRGYGFKLWR